jgi:hypothetical protein
MHNAQTRNEPLRIDRVAFGVKSRNHVGSSDHCRVVAPMHIARESLARWLIVTILTALSIYHLALTASTVLTFSLRYPFMDQFRLNLRYLTIPFPESVLLLENGHRPVLPGLVRLVELNWFKGTQLLQALTSWGAAAVVVAMLVLAVKRDLRGNYIFIAAGICAICSTLLWNANARMFIHAYEAMHVFYVTLFAMVAIHCAMRAPDTGAWKWWIGSIVACVAATFSFGMGFASFGAVAIVPILRRRGWLPVLFILLAALATFSIYYAVLPGAAGVQGVTSGHSVPAVIFFAFARVGAFFAELLRLFVPDLALQAAVGALAGAAGIAVITVLSIRQWNRRAPFGDLELYGLGLAVFGLLSNLLIAVSRTGYFFEYPGQVFADRYLFWSCVTWLGIYLCLLPRLVRGKRIGQLAAATSVILFSLAAVPPARWDNQWSSAVYTVSSMAGVAMKMGIRNDAQVGEVSDSDAATTYRVVDEMRARNLGMFADASHMRVGDKVEAGASRLSVAVKAARFDVDWPVGASARRFSGELPQSLAAQEQGAELWFADADGTLMGRAAFTNAGSKPRNVLLLGIPTLSGFQGYVMQSATPTALLALEPGGAMRQLSRLELLQ